MERILIINAHWETKDIINITVQQEHTQLDYDYEGYPPEAYQIRYYSPGDRILSNHVKSLFEAEKAQSNAFVDELTQVLTKSDEHERENVLINWEEKLVYARLNHPREEHFVPLHIVVGAAGSDSVELLNPNIIKKETAFKFGI